MWRRACAQRSYMASGFSRPSTLSAEGEGKPSRFASRGVRPEKRCSASCSSAPASVCGVRLQPDLHRSAEGEEKPSRYASRGVRPEKRCCASPSSAPAWVLGLLIRHATTSTILVNSRDRGDLGPTPRPGLVAAITAGVQIANRKRVAPLMYRRLDTFRR